MARQVTVRVDKARFDQVCWTLVKEVRANKFPFNIMWLPQHATPPEITAQGPLVLSRALFLANFFMRGQQQSNYVFGQIMKMCLAFPELMDPGFMSQEWVTEEYVFDRLKPYLKYRLFEMPKIILQAFRRLKEDWGGDPRKIVEGIEDPDDPSGTSSEKLHRRMVNIESIPKRRRHPEQMRGFLGMRQKIANLFPYFMRALELMTHEIKMETAFDLHACRTFIATRAIIVEGGTASFDDITRIGSKAAEEFCIENNVPTNVLMDGYWWNSKAMCARAPGNRTLGRKSRKIRHRKKRHKLGYKPQRRGKAKLSLYQPDYSEQRDIHRYERSCGKCALEQLCSLNVSSGIYSDEGKFVTQLRTKPLPHLFGHGNLHHHTNGKKKVPEPPKKEAVVFPLFPGLKLKKQKKPRKRLATAGRA